MEIDDDLQHSPERIVADAMKRLRARVRLSRYVLWIERLTRAFWASAVCFLAVFAILSWGLTLGLRPELLAPFIAAIALAGIWLGIRGGRSFERPKEDDAIKRLDLDLDGRPLSSLTDRIALGRGDPQAEYLWALHIQNMAARAKAARVVGADLRLSGRDPWAIRLVALLAVGSALIFARGDIGQTLFEELTQGNPATAIASGPSFEAWAEPPRYTGAPTIYLNEVDSDTKIALPTGSEILVRVYGYDGSATLTESVTPLGNSKIGDTETDIADLRFVAVQSGLIKIAPKGRTEWNWKIEIIPDAAPLVEVTGEVTRNIDGAIQLPFRASDDYGVVGGQMTATLDVSSVVRKYGLEPEPEAHADIAIDLPLPFNGDMTEFEDTLVEDRAKHPWAGLPVVMQLGVEDAAGNYGQNAPFETVMPGKRFFDPLAAALIDVRRSLLWNRANATRSIQLIRAVTWKGDDLFEDEEARKLTLQARDRLEELRVVRLSDADRDTIADLLWEAALLVEDGDLDSAKERLERAQQRLREAMENGATNEEIAQLMQELRDATQEYMRELAENAEEADSDEMQQSMQNAPQMSMDQIQQMMDRIQELMEEGRMDEAMALMEQLQQMLENMRVVRNNSQQGEAQEGLQDTLRQQQELADETFRELQEQFERERQQGQQQGQQQSQQQPGQDQGQQGQQPGQQQGQQGQQQGQTGQQQGQQGQQGNQQGQQQGQNGQQGEGQRPGEGRGAGSEVTPGDLAGRQEALRQMLGGQRGDLESGEGGEALEEANRAMREAERNMAEARDRLENGDIGGALDQQSEAMDALREGLRQLNDAGRAQGQAQQGQGQQNGNGPNGQANPLDPLGRFNNGQFSDNVAPNKGLDRTAQDRSREMFDEIRRRSNDQTRSKQERSYLERLLDRF